MLRLEVFANGDKCWPDLVTRGYRAGRIVGIARLPGGLASGRSSVTVRIELGDSTIVLGETSLAALYAAVLALWAIDEKEGQA